jgi:hypothetical protein
MTERMFMQMHRILAILVLISVTVPPMGAAQGVGLAARVVNFRKGD